MSRKKAIVTGASSGIGRGIAYKLAQAGYDVAFSYNTGEEKAKKVLNDLTEKYPDGHFYMFQAQFDKKGAAKEFFDKAAESLQGLDLFVNNAGVTLYDPVMELEEDRMDLLINVLFKNYILMMKETSKYMIANGIRGSIVNISSVRSFCVHTGDMVYGAIKAGLDRACKSAALDCAHYGIRVNNILPGAIMRFTPEESAKADPAHVAKVKYLSARIPLQRYGTPEDIGNAVVFLASENAGYITGTTLVIDGGLSLPSLAETQADSDACGWGAID